MNTDTPSRDINIGGDLGGQILDNTGRKNGSDNTSNIGNKTEGEKKSSNVGLLVGIILISIVSLIAIVVLSVMIIQKNSKLRKCLTPED
jgi:hypothetical protein